MIEASLYETVDLGDPLDPKARISWALGILGLRGMSFSADHHSGRAVGDQSESFFGERSPGSSGGPS